MPKTYDFGLSPYENTKQNLISLRSSQNRFGGKFKTLYNRHKEINGDKSVYHFKEGMRALFAKDGIQEQIDTVASLIDAFSIFGTSPAGNNYDLQDALLYSYVRVRFTYDNMWDIFSLIGYQVTISCSLDASDTDKRKKSTYLKRANLPTANALVLDPLEDPAETFGVKLYTDTGVEYGHYADPPLPAGLTSGEIDNTFTTDATIEKNADDNFIFNQTIESDFDAIQSDFEKYLQDYIYSTEYLNTMTVTDNDIIVFSLGQMLDFLQDEKANLQDFLDGEDDSDRAKEDLELIRLLHIEESLKENISKPHKIKSIYFRWQKECTMPQSGNWWEAEELQKMQPHGVMQKAMLEHCDIPADGVVAGDKFWIYPKDSFLTLPNWQVCLFVQTFMDIKTTVKKKWYQKGLGKLLVAIVTVALIVLTENPTWAKVLLSVAAVGSQYGLIGGKMQMVLTAAMMVYGISSADFSAMSGTEMFSFAVQNINMTANIVQLQQQASLEASYKKHQKEIDDYYATKNQEEATRYIYTDGYDEFSTFYDVLYHY